MPKEVKGVNIEILRIYAALHVGDTKEKGTKERERESGKNRIRPTHVWGGGGL